MRFAPQNEAARSPVTLISAMMVVATMLVVGFGQVSAAAGSSSDLPPMPPAPRVHVKHVRHVPRSIASDGSRDVTRPLTRFLNRVHPNTRVVFRHNGSYRVEGTLWIRHATDLVIDGNGATIRATTRGNRDRRHVRFWGGSNIIVRDLTVHGANKHAGTGKAAWDVHLEAQHGFEIDGTRGITLEHVKVFNVWGDFVYMGAQLVSAGNFVPAENVRVINSHFARNGRQGITFAFCQDVLVRGSYLGDIRRATFDIETNTSGAAVDDVRIIGNTTGPGRLGWLSNAGAGSHISHIYVIGNRMKPHSNTGGVVRVINKNPDGYRGPYIIEDNHFHVTSSPWGAFAFMRVDGIQIDHNVVTFPSYAHMPAVTLIDSHHSVVRDNRFRGAGSVYDADGDSSNYTEAHNRLS